MKKLLRALALLPVIPFLIPFGIFLATAFVTLTVIEFLVSCYTFARKGYWLYEGPRSLSSDELF